VTTALDAEGALASLAQSPANIANRRFDAPGINGIELSRPSRSCIRRLRVISDERLPLERAAARSGGLRRGGLRAPNLTASTSSPPSCAQSSPGPREQPPIPQGRRQLGRVQIAHATGSRSRLGRRNLAKIWLDNHVLRD